MKKIYSIIITFLILFSFSGCNDFVTNVEKPIDVVAQKDLTAADMPFLMRTVEFRYAQTVTNLLMCAEGLSDTFVFDRDVPNATYSQYDEIDKGEILTNNNSVRGFFNSIGELRKYADELVDWSNKFQLDAATKNNALYLANFYGGMARYFYAAYIGLEPTKGGGTIDLGPFIPSDQMYALAIKKFEAALATASTEAKKRVVNSFLARVYLLTGDYAKATTYALAGMKVGDDPFRALFHKEVANQYYIFAGRFRAQFTMDARFKKYITENPEEKRPVGINTTDGRICLDSVKGSSGKWHWRQGFILKEDDPLTTCTWQENSLMLAELALRGQANAGNALALVNAVRASHKISPLATIDLDGIYVERDKELNIQGIRLLDQRRFNKFHLPAGKWQYFPITIDELNANPYLPK